MHTVLETSADMETSLCSHSLQIHGWNKETERVTYFEEFYKAVHLGTSVRHFYQFCFYCLELMLEEKVESWDIALICSDVECSCVSTTKQNKGFNISMDTT